MCISDDDDDDDSNDPEFDDKFDKDDKDIHSPVYPREQWQKIIEFWENNGKKRKFSTVVHKFKKLKDCDQSILYKWKERMRLGEYFKYIFSICILLYIYLKNGF